ncbi:DoxX family protein [Siphonobacter sp. SORGH_AS_0500]|uniref:DoxX family protein n=1 Tax=Siphonobacter sp. SORGH_AS_0500 TaxID=1864824 RepID=UPI000CA9A354|nr:DoxX family protein [Siphonobacter sp. SORGH_AS_0500]MDR6197967.1 putative oxidoreductase [Siphonobacter sp. SORGH_AS_0500]PKK37139.1 DoxX-like family protein [Siphonobacter sp. SORGH_AS_0500]
MKSQKIIYWISTGLFAVWMLANAKAYLTSEEAKRLCVHFGFPDYFRVELAIAKILGTAALLLPVVRNNPKEWAYAGFFITVVSGFIAHLASGDSLISSSFALLALALLLTSYFTYHRLNQ